MPHDFDKIINADDEYSTFEPFVNEGLEKNPDSFSKTVQLADKAGLSPELVEGDERNVENDLRKKQALDWYKLEIESPILYERMRSIKFSGQAHDDVPQLSAMEKLFYRGEQISESVSETVDAVTKPFENITETIPLGFENVFAGIELAGIEEHGGVSYPHEKVQGELSMADFASRGDFSQINRRIESGNIERIQRSTQLIEDIYQRNETIDDLTPDDLNIFQEGARGAVDSIAYIIPAIGAGALTGGAGALSMIGAASFGKSYGDGRSKGLSPNESLLYGSVQAGIEVGTEVLPIGTLMDMYRRNSTATDNVLKFVRQEMTTEQLATIGQSITDYVAGLDEELENAPLSDWPEIQGRRQAVTAVATMFAGGAQVGAVTSINKAIESTLNEEQVREQRSRQDQEHIDNVAVTAASSKLKGRNVEEYKSFVENAAKDEVVYIDGPQAALYLQGKNIEGDPVLTTLSEQVTEANATNGEVMISVADFAGDVVGSEHFDSLRPHMTMSNDTLSPFRQENERVERESYVKNLIEKANQESQLHNETSVIFNEVVDQMINSGQVSKRNAEMMAQIVPAWVTVKSKELNIPVEQLFNDIGLTIEGPFEERKAAIGQVMEQSDIKSPEFINWSGNGPVIESEDINDFDFNQDDPKVLKVFHGTTHEFSVFDANRGNLEGQFGAINYFTSSESDARDNYAGAGPDLTNRIEQRTEQLEQQYEDNPQAYGMYEDTDFNREARDKAVEELQGDKDQVMELFVKVDNPFVIGQNNFIEFVDNDSIQEQAVMRVAEEHEIDPEEVDLDEYADEIDEARWEFQEEEPNKLTEAIQTIADNNNVDPSTLLSELYDLAEGATPEQIESMLRSSEDFSYAQSDSGELIGSDLISQVIEEMGFDSIILRDAESRFATMDMEPGTTHIHIFDANKTNIKSTENKGMFSPVDPDIYNQELRGYYEPSNVLIRLNEASDSSTFMHEFAHFMLDMEYKYEGSKVSAINEWFTRISDDLVTEANVYLRKETSDILDSSIENKQSPEYATEALRLANEGGITEQDLTDFINGDLSSPVKYNQLNRATHEQFARGFEVYLMEGKAPSVELREMFRELARMIVAVYKSIQSQFNAPKVDDEMKQVFDRLIASEEQIKQVETSDGYAPLFTSAVMAGMTEKKYQEYLKRQLKPKNKAAETLREKLLKELTRYHKKEWKRELEEIKEIKEDELLQERQYVAIERLKNRPEYKLDYDSVKELLNVKKIPYQLNGMTTKNPPVHYDPAVVSLASELVEEGGVSYIKDEHGKITGRTPSLNPEWHKSSTFVVMDIKNEKPIKTPSVKVIKKAVDAYSKDEKLSKPQVKILEALDSVVKDEKAESRLKLSPEEKQFQEELDILIMKSFAVGYNDKLQNAINQGYIENLEDVADYNEIVDSIPLVELIPTNIQGNHPDDIAPALQYNSGIEMLNDIMSTPTLNKASYDAAETEMLAKHGDILNDGTLEQIAEDEARNEEQGETLLREVKILSKALNVPAIDKKTIQLIARQSIGKLKYSEIRPERYRKAEIRSAQEAVTHMNNGDKDLAMRSKTQQVMNFYLWREAKDARDLTDKITTYATKLSSKKVRQKIAQAGNEYWDQIENILARFEFNKSVSLKQHKSNLDIWLANRSVDMDNIQLSNKVLKEDYKQHWRDIPHDILVGVYESLRSIQHNSKSASDILIAEKKHTFDQAKKKMLESMDKVKDKFTPQRSDIVDPTHDDLFTGKSNQRAFLAENTKVPWLMSWLDGGERIGVMHDTIMQPTTDALYEEMNLLKEVTEPITVAMEGRTNEDKIRHSKDIFIPEIKNKATETLVANDGILKGHQVLAVALNVGTESNMRKMLIGEGWAVDDAQATIDNTQLQAVLKHMTEADWDLVELIWNQINLMYPKLNEVHERSSGLPLQKVEGVEFVLKSGRKVQGMYYPMHYDPNRSLKAKANAIKANAEILSMLNGTGSMMPSATTGARIERKGFTGPVALTLDVVPQHIQEVAHFITHFEAVKQVNKFINDPDIQLAIIAKMGNEEYDILKPWLNSIAKNGRSAETKRWLDNTIDRLRFGTTLGIMGFKASTMIIQVAGLFNTMGEVGVLPVLNSQVKLGTDPIYRAIKTIFSSEQNTNTHVTHALEKSKVLPHRLKTYDREVSNAAKNIKKHRGSKFRKIQELAMYPIGAIQFYAVDLPSWYAGFEKGMSEYEGDEARSIKYADWVVEQIQGSGAIKDMSQLMATNNAYMKMFTMFMTFFSSAFNANRDVVRQVKSGDMSVVDATGKFTLMWLLPAIFEELVRNGLSDDDDDESTFEKILINTAITPLATNPVTRLSSSLLSGYRANSSPVLTLAEQGVDAIKTGNTKAVSKLVGAYYGVPGVNQMWLTGEHLSDVIQEGEELTLRQLAYGPRK